MQVAILYKKKLTYLLLEIILFQMYSVHCDKTPRFLLSFATGFCWTGVVIRCCWCQRWRLCSSYRPVFAVVVCATFLCRHSEAQLYSWNLSAQDVAKLPIPGPSHCLVAYQRGTCKWRRHLFFQDQPLLKL